MNKETYQYKMYIEGSVIDVGNIPTLTECRKEAFIDAQKATLKMVDINSPESSDSIEVIIHIQSKVIVNEDDEQITDLDTYKYVTNITKL